MDASFIACTLPFFLRSKLKWVAIVPALAVIRSGSITAILAATVSFLVLWRPIYSITVIIVGAIMTMYFPLHHEILNTNGRIDHWNRALKFFLEHDSFWQGLGTGSFTLHSDKFWPEQQWIWAHNEFLQVFFEQGAVGLTLLMITVGRAFRAAQKDRFKLACFASYFIVMCSLNPFRYLASAFLGGVILSLCHQKRSI